jgi:hypothetical protein
MSSSQATERQPARRPHEGANLTELLSGSVVVEHGVAKLVDRGIVARVQL